MTRICRGAFVCGVLLVSTPLVAQEHQAWRERTYVSVDLPIQSLRDDFTESLSFPDTTRRTENVTFVARYKSVRGPLFGAGGGVRVLKNLGVGVTTSWFERSGSGAFDLGVPSPIVANRPLSLNDSVSDLNHEELGVHLQALYALSLGRRTRIMMSGGPSIFKTRQDLVRSIEFDKLPGFTGLQFEQALVTTAEKTSVGFNIGAEITWALSEHYGVGTLTRYSRSTVTLDPGSATGLPRAIDTHAGGLHLGGGIRVFF